LCFKSEHFPGECVATRRGSPLLVGIKTKTRLATDHIPILYSKGKCSLSEVVICLRVKLFINNILDLYLLKSIYLIVLYIYQIAYILQEMYVTLQDILVSSRLEYLVSSNQP
jgi:hypothetical protein